MARQVVNVCDLHETRVLADHQLSWKVEGSHGRLDLCSEHLAELKARLPFLASGESLPHGRTPHSRRHQRDERTLVRAWARENGFLVASRGRLPQAVVKAYADDGRRQAVPLERPL